MGPGPDRKAALLDLCGQNVLTCAPAIFKELPDQFVQIMKGFGGYTDSQVKYMQRRLARYNVLYFNSGPEQINLPGDDQVGALFAAYLRKTNAYLLLHSRHAARDATREKDRDRELDTLFADAYAHYLSGSYWRAKDLCEEMLCLVIRYRVADFGMRLHVLSLAASAAHKLGQFHDALHFAVSGRTLSEKMQLGEAAAYFEEIVYITENTAGIERTWHAVQYSLLAPRIEKQLQIPASLEDKIYRSLNYSPHTSLLRDVKIYDAREVRKYSTEGTGISEYIEEIKGIGPIAQLITPIMVYVVKECLAFGVIYEEAGRGKMTVIKTSIVVSALLQRLKAVQERNKELLKRKCDTDEEKREWWRGRTHLDREIEKEVRQINTYLEKCMLKGIRIRNQVVLVLEELLGTVPFEMCDVFMEHGVTRCSSLGQMLKESQCKRTHTQAAGSKSLFYILNPENNLPRTEERVSSFLSQHLPEAQGIKNRVPEKQEVEREILKNDVFLYFGHGAGEKFFTPQVLGSLTPRNCRRDKYVFLFGCSSAKLISYPNYNPQSTALSYMYNPSIRLVLGTLWDITDKDLDMITVEILAMFARQRRAGSANACADPSLARMLTRLRHQCRLKYLNGGAVVLYGKE